MLSPSRNGAITAEAHDVRTRYAARGARRPQRGRAGVRFGQQHSPPPTADAAPHQLEGGFAAKREILGSIDIAHAAGGHPLDEPIVADDVPGQQAIVPLGVAADPAAMVRSRARRRRPVGLQEVAREVWDEARLDLASQVRPPGTARLEQGGAALRIQRRGGGEDGLDLRPGRARTAARQSACYRCFPSSLELL